MSPTVTISFDGRGSRQYFPGETLAGSYRFISTGFDEITAVETSILWSTEGKGNADIGIHAFFRLSTDEGDWIDPRKPGRFQTTLPPSPLTYHGALVKIDWRVRVRVFLADGPQIVEELPFRLGQVRDPRTIRPPEISVSRESAPHG
jgi:hypothetical protein